MTKLPLERGTDIPSRGSLCIKSGLIYITLLSAPGVSLLVISDHFWSPKSKCKSPSCGPGSAVALFLLVSELLTLVGSGSPSSLNRFATGGPGTTPQRVLRYLLGLEHHLQTMPHLPRTHLSPQILSKYLHHSWYPRPQSLIQTLASPSPLGYLR